MRPSSDATPNADKHPCRRFTSSTRACPCTGRAGFSLIEIVIVIVIVSVLMTIGVPRYTSAISNYRADMASRRVRSDLRLAQTKARTQSKVYTIEFSEAASTYVIYDGTNLGLATDVTLVDLRKAPYYAEIQDVTLGDGTVDTMQYDGYGMPDKEGSVKVKSGDRTENTDVRAQDYTPPKELGG